MGVLAEQGAGSNGRRARHTGGSREVRTGWHVHGMARRVALAWRGSPRAPVFYMLARYKALDEPRKALSNWSVAARQ